MTVWAVVLTIFLGFVVNECCEISPWAAKKIAAWSARLRYDDPERAEIRSEELASLIEKRPGKLLKLITALCFAAAALCTRARRTMAGLSAQVPIVFGDGTLALKKTAIVAVAGMVAFTAVLAVEMTIARGPSGVFGIHRAVPSAAEASPLQAAVRLVAAFGPGGITDGDDPQIAGRAINGDPARPWTSEWYATPYFDDLKAGTGLLLDMGRAVKVDSVRVWLGGGPGADLELRAGREPVLADLARVKSTSGANGAVQFRLAAPVRARYLLIWFTRLPPQVTGTYQASVWRINVQGRSLPRQCTSFKADRHRILRGRSTRILSTSRRLTRVSAWIHR